MTISRADSSSTLPKSIGFPFFYLSLALSGHPKIAARFNPCQVSPPRARSTPSTGAHLAGLTSIPRGPAFSYEPVRTSRLSVSRDVAERPGLAL